MVVGTTEDVVVGYGIVRWETLRDDTRLGVIEEIYVEPEARVAVMKPTTSERLVNIANACALRRVFGRVDIASCPPGRRERVSLCRTGSVPRCREVWAERAQVITAPE